MDIAQEKYSIAFMCEMLEVSRQGYYKWLKSKDRPYKYEHLLTLMKKILEEDQENENYGIIRMYEKLKLDNQIKESQSTVYRVMKENGFIHKKKRNPQSLTKADKEAQKSDNLLNGNFEAQAPNEKWVTDITQLQTADGALYISAIFDCYDNSVVGLTMDDNMRKELVISTLEQAMTQYRAKNVTLHSDRGSQYTSEAFRETILKYGLNQSMNGAGGRCHDNAKCESMWARFKEEKIYGKTNTAKMPMEAVKRLVFRYFMSYWNNRRICSANGGFPPAIKRNIYYSGSILAA
jgi:transposase InsO family protein